MIGLGIRELADELKCSHGTAVASLRELDDAGLAHPVTLGRYPGKKATEWRLTFKRCDATGELPILNWEARPEVTTESTKGHVGKRKPLIRSRGKAQMPKNPMSDPGLRSRGEAHVYIYQGDTALVAVTGGATEPTPDEPLEQASNNFDPSDERVAMLDNWGVASQRKRFEQVKARFDALPDPRLWAAA
jgi:hypothetical protein